VNALKQQVSKNYFNIEYMSTKTLEALINTGLVNDIGDIFNLTEQDLATLPTGEVYQTDTKEHKTGDQIPLGETTAVKIYQAIQRGKHVGLAKVLSSLNIPLLGRSLGKNLTRKYTDIEDILAATPEDLMDVELISDVKAEIISQGLKMRRPLIEKLRQAGVEMTASPAGVPVKLLQTSAEGGASVGEPLQNQPLKGQTIVISGSIPGYNREEARDLVESLGAKSSGSVSSKTTLVIADPSSTSSKVQKAHQLDINVITAQEFLEKYAN
jgi:DNA ligase (NAD+)